MIQPTFIDLHLHTSTNANEPNLEYQIQELKENIEKYCGKSEYLISITDHNFINTEIYLKAVSNIKNMILGVELHIRNYDATDPYHCHMLFNEAITKESIDPINKKLNILYPDKIVGKDTKSIPNLELIVKTFLGYDFMILPHGGQSHSEFHKSIPKGVIFDTAIENIIYHNQFDGFTARSIEGLEKTKDYFKKLGIGEFVNLITSTDNYVPRNYPKSHNSNAPEFVPTWMLSNPTFDGLRLALSEADRLKYGKKPDNWSEFINRIILKNQNIDIDITLSPGLNVVIGGSSSGKTLLVDSIYRAIANKMENKFYEQSEYEVQNINIENPSGLIPHYFEQNYIMKICDQKDKENKIDDITILKNVFPSDENEILKINNGLASLKIHLSKLIKSVEKIELLQESLKRIPSLPSLIVTKSIHPNPLVEIEPSPDAIKKISYGEARYENDVERLESISDFLEKNPLIDHNRQSIDVILKELFIANRNSEFEERIREVITKHKKDINDMLLLEGQEIASKRIQFENLLKIIRDYLRLNKDFEAALKLIFEFKIEIDSKKIESMGHTLFISNQFKLNKEKFIEVLNESLIKSSRLTPSSIIRPEDLFKSNFSSKPKVKNYNDLGSKINSKFDSLNKKNFKITTKDGRDFDQLSAGWKTSIILDLILGWEKDLAPLIIDQPEDNLATEYMNNGLISAIKKCKVKKQIILVSHNATIPMLGDAQTIVVCENKDKNIIIRSGSLEGKINTKKVLDYVAEITDGGKVSIKKRVKKYNFKEYRR